MTTASIYCEACPDWLVCSSVHCTLNEANGHSEGRQVAGYCPWCGTESLRLSDAGRITCVAVDCTRRTSVSELLADSEPGHLVVFTPEGFTIRHPLAERLDDALLACELHEACSEPPVTLGRYRAIEDDDIWVFEFLGAFQ